MAKYDHGGGCPCGLYKECDEGCENYILNIRYVKEFKMNLNEDDDFGFTFVDSNEIQQKVASTEDKLAGLQAMIMPLLANLKKNPEKDTIYWPDREKKINAFIKKMNDYVKS